MSPSRASCVKLGGNAARRSDWWRRVSAKRGCEDDNAFAEVRIGIILVVSCCAFAKSERLS